MKRLFLLLQAPCCSQVAPSSPITLNADGGPKPQCPSGVCTITHQPNLRCLGTDRKLI